MQQSKTFFWIYLLVAMTGRIYSQEFPIAVGNDNTFGGGGAYDGTNFLFAVMGDASDQYNMTAQLISASGNHSGPRISLGKTGSGPVVAFDGTNYLVVWTDNFPMFAGGNLNGIGSIYGQFISTSGNLVGTTFTIVADVNIKFGKGRGGLTFQGTTYLLTYFKGGNHTDYLYGQRIGRSGELIGSPVQISQDYARECAIAFDGTNYLVAWVKCAYPALDKDIYGQFVSTSGALVGTNFLIDGSQYASDNPVSMAFDGSRYLVSFHEQAADNTGRWNLCARFVSTSGAIAERFTICDSSRSPMVPLAAFDGKNYLMTWIEFAGRMSIKGRFFSTSGIPIDTAFALFDTLGGKSPFGGVGGFVNGHYILTATRIDTNFTNGDIYGRFLQASTTGINEQGIGLSPTGFVLSQNYPNPFNPATTVEFRIQNSEFVTLKVYDLLGQEVTTLVNEKKAPGSYSVRFDAGGLSSGVYFYRLQAGSFVDTKKLLLLR